MHTHTQTPLPAENPPHPTNQPPSLAHQPAARTSKQQHALLTKPLFLVSAETCWAKGQHKRWTSQAHTHTPRCQVLTHPGASRQRAAGSTWTPLQGLAGAKPRTPPAMHTAMHTLPGSPQPVCCFLYSKQPGSMCGTGHRPHRPSTRSTREGGRAKICVAQGTLLPKQRRCVAKGDEWPVCRLAAAPYVWCPCSLEPRRSSKCTHTHRHTHLGEERAPAHTTRLRGRGPHSTAQHGAARLATGWTKEGLA
jgi:hypothetical protein